MSSTAECDAQIEAVVTAFLLWLNRTGWIICRWHPEIDRYAPKTGGTSSLFDQFRREREASDGS